MVYFHLWFLSITCAFLLKETIDKLSEINSFRVKQRRCIPHFDQINVKITLTVHLRKTFLMSIS